MLRLFQDNFVFGEATSSHFFRVTSSPPQLHFRSSYFFRAAAFFSSFRIVTFSQQFFFQNRFFFRAKMLLGSYSSEQLFFPEELFRIKVSKNELLFKGGTSVQYQLFQKSYILEKANFSVKQYSALPTFT